VCEDHAPAMVARRKNRTTGGRWQLWKVVEAIMCVAGLSTLRRMWDTLQHVVARWSSG